MSRKVLVVDDNELIRSLVEHYLVKEGWFVEKCDGPFGVLNKVREYKPDVVLMDIRMPGLSGDKLAKILKDASRANEVKIIAFSSEDEELQKQLLKDGVVDGYFVKSHTLNGLCETMGRVLDPDCPPGLKPL